MLLKKSKPSLSERLTTYLRKDKKLERLYRLVRQDFLKANMAAHNWEHVYRDTLNAIVIGEAEGADMTLVLPAIMLHDIGFLYGGSGKEHAAVGAEKLPMYLKKIGISYPKQVVEHIADCIRTHKGSRFHESPETLEAKVVCDADLLEKFGPFGVYQYIRTYTEFKKNIENIIQQKNNMDLYQLETKTGKKLAEPGRKFVVDFFKTLDKAYDPYR